MNVKARLDRALVNQHFLDLFEFSCVKHITSAESDNFFMLAELRTTPVTGWARPQRSFCYENVWQTHDDYDEMVGNMWLT